VAGCSVSIACLFLNGVFALLAGSTGQRKLSKQIDVCLSLNLALAQVFVIFALENHDLTGDGLACVILACVMHYLFLTSFSWMFIKGVHLYLNVTRVSCNKVEVLCSNHFLTLVVFGVSSNLLNHGVVKCVHHNIYFLRGFEHSLQI
jgi:hypothetical protein